MDLLVNIDVDDLSKAIAFYQQAAGLRLADGSARSRPATTNEPHREYLRTGPRSSRGSSCAFR